MLELELKSVELELHCVTGEDCGDILPDYWNNPLRHTQKLIREEALQLRDLVSRRDALRLTINRLKRRLRVFRFKDVWTEGDPDIDQPTTVSVYENFEDNAGNGVDEKGEGSPDTLPTGQVNVLDMGNFLARPLRIAQAEIKVDDHLTLELDIWDEFTSHPAVRAKLRNYAYFSGDLHVRVTVSGTPWHFGKIQASYQPLAGYNDNLALVAAKLVGADRVAALTYLSQSRESTTIDVHDNKPLELTCPFISPQPMLRLFNKSPLILPAASSFENFVGFGKLYLNTISPLRAIGTTATSVGIQIYAWVTNLKLGMPTGTVIEIGTEGDPDERVAGPVEKISSNAAKVASAISQVPIIGPYADAAVRPLTALSSVASWFGFSYPTMITAPERVKNEPFQNSSNTIGHDTGQRLTLDPKQGLSVDPETTGTSVDEMAISHIVGVDSLLDVFDWKSSDGQMASSIWMCPVNPMASKRFLQTPGPPAVYDVAPTALAFAAKPFYYWRGEITYRFEIVCSQFHRGTLAVIFEPNISQNVVIDTVLDLNKQFMKKIDLQSTRDFEVTVAWAFPRPWARVLPTSLLGDVGAVGFLGDALFNYANGYIAVVPYTELQSPDDSDITINVYVKSNDMQFNQLASRTELPSAMPTTEGDPTPNVVDSGVLNPTTANEDHVSSLNFGEQPASFRSLLKRFSSWEDSSVQSLSTANTSTEYVRKYVPLYPRPYPRYGSAPTLAMNSLYGYLRFAYLGMRGGVKCRVNPYGPIPMDATAVATVILRSPATTYVETLTGEPSNTNGAACQQIGSHQFVPFTNGGIEFEIPLYTPNLFMLSFLYTAVSATHNLMDDSFTSGAYVNFIRRPSTATADDPIRVVVSRAAAEDFSFMRYSGAPMYQYTSP